MPLSGGYPVGFIARVGFTPAVNLQAAAPNDNAVVITPPDGGTWVIASLGAANFSGVATNHAGTFQSAAAGGGTNLGTMNLSSATTSTSRSIYPLAVTATGSTTVYLRTTVASTPASTCDLFAIAIKVS